jgi:hypothetical protein
LQSAQLRFSLPCGQGLQTVQLLFSLPCEHRFFPIVRGRASLQTFGACAQSGAVASPDK